VKSSDHDPAGIRPLQMQDWLRKRLPIGSAVFPFTTYRSYRRDYEVIRLLAIQDDQTLINLSAAFSKATWFDLPYHKVGDGIRVKSSKWSNPGQRLVEMLGETLYEDKHALRMGKIL
jgi:hypothetical protein